MPFEREYAAHDFMKSLERNGYSIGQFVSADKAGQEAIFAVLKANDNQHKLDFSEQKFDEEAYKKRALNGVTAFKEKMDKVEKLKMYRPGISELDSNEKLGSTNVRLCEFLNMKSDERKDILAILKQDADKKPISPVGKQLFIDPEEGFDDDEYLKKADKTIHIFKKKTDVALGISDK